MAVIAVGVLFLPPVASPADEPSGAQRGPSRGTAQNVARIDSEPLLTIGNKPENALFRVIGVALVGDALIVAEASSNTLRYYDRATGELLRTTGGEGEGPGEYRALVFLQAVGHRLYTFDFVNRRLTVLDAAGAVEKTVTIQPWEGYPYHSDIRDLNGLIWVHQYHWWESPGERWTLYAKEGERVGEVSSTENLWVAAADGDVVAILRRDELGVEMVELRRLVGWR